MTYLLASARSKRQLSWSEHILPTIVDRRGSEDVWGIDLLQMLDELHVQPCREGFFGWQNDCRTHRQPSLIASIGGRHPNSPTELAHHPRVMNHS
jgi:hypothetical protein